MTIWQQIDSLKAKHAKEVKETRNALERLRAISGSLEFDDYCRWTCRYIPKGQRAHLRLTARSGAGLVERLKAIRETEAARR